MKVKVKPIFAWYDLWIGFFWDQKKHKLYFFPVPCFGLVFKFNPFKSEYEKKCESIRNAYAQAQKDSMKKYLDKTS